MYGYAQLVTNGASYPQRAGHPDYTIYTHVLQEKHMEMTRYSYGTYGASFHVCKVDDVLKQT